MIAHMHSVGEVDYSNTHTYTSALYVITQKADDECENHEREAKIN